MRTTLSGTTACAKCHFARPLNLQSSISSLPHFGISTSASITFAPNSCQYWQKMNLLAKKNSIMADGVAGVFGIPGSHQAGSAASVQTTFQQPVGEAHSWKILRNKGAHSRGSGPSHPGPALGGDCAGGESLATAVQLVNEWTYAWIYCLVLNIVGIE